MPPMQDPRAPAAAAQPQPQAPAGLAMLRRLPLAGRIGLAIVVFWALVALLGPAIAPHAVGAMVSQEVFDPISRQFPLGSDYLGRDVLSRMLLGARYTVGLASAAALLASLTGTAAALLATVGGRVTGELLGRFMDTLISVPSKIFALVMVAAFGSSVGLLLLTAAVTYVPGAFRIARALATNIHALEFVQAARARGEGRFAIAVREILPNMLATMAADFGLRFMFIVLLLSGLSFLGLGVQPPDADLGSLVRENLAGLTEAAPAVLVPALSIASLTIGVNLLIDALSFGGARTGRD
ncbi:MAG: ABC transporter permease [Steroidobacteraceae bacterium]